MIYERLGLVEETDLNALYRRFGVKGDKIESVEDLEVYLAERTTLGKRKIRSARQRDKEQ
jgi:hypothetical protein